MLQESRSARCNLHLMRGWKLTFDQYCRLSVITKIAGMTRVTAKTVMAGMTRTTRRTGITTCRMTSMTEITDWNNYGDCKLG